MFSSDTLAPPPAPSDSGIDALVVVAGLAGIAADAGTLRHQAACDGPADALSLVRLASRLGLKVRLLRPAPARWPQLPLPAILEGRDGRFVVLLKVAGAEAL